MTNTKAVVRRQVSKELPAEASHLEAKRLRELCLVLFAEGAAERPSSVVSAYLTLSLGSGTLSKTMHNDTSFYHRLIDMNKS